MQVEIAMYAYAMGNIRSDHCAHSITYHECCVIKGPYLHMCKNKCCDCTYHPYMGKLLYARLAKTR